MSIDPSHDPRTRLRNILSNGETTPVTPPDESPLSRLPKARPAVSSSQPPSPQPQLPPEPPPQTPSLFQRYGPAFWTVTGILSLVVNSILIAVLFYLWSSMNSLQLTASDTGANVLSGLYTNFEKMDRASIISTIPVDAQIPLNLNVPIQRTSRITLASDSVIQNARVRINTATLNIDAPAQVILPAGTTLEVGLDFVVSIQDNVPVHLEVPINIPLSQTQLHEPFTGLQDVLKPFYCLIDPNAVNLDGLPVCR